MEHSDGNSTQPLLTNTADDSHPHPQTAAVFTAGTPDIAPITGPGDFYREFMVESKKLWFLAGPAIFSFVSKYSLGAFTQIFAGHVGTIDLAAVSVENSLIAGFSFGIMLGMGSALETLCGQAVGAGNLDMLGLNYSESHRPRPQHISSCGKIRRMDDSAAVCIRAQFSGGEVLAGAEQGDGDRCDIRGGHGGAPVVELVANNEGGVGSGGCGGGAKWVVVVYSSGSVGLCVQWLVLETWYFMAIILFAGYLKNAEISVDAFSICVRISNELGAHHPRTALFSLVVAVMTSILIGLLLALVLMISRNEYPSLFSNDTEVKKLVKELTPFLCFCIVINNVQPVLSGVAIGAGWQALVAYVNIGCYYLFGIPVGLVLGYKVDWGVKLFIVVNCWISGNLAWNDVRDIAANASLAKDRIRTWGGHKKANDKENTQET
ncbi:unnamed protein product [Sphenostylis stenocarpa]|uniref:Multidrug and toxin extrusion protein n=1 Tax=Sphenostylis stenocarpa TaxID=92480 RepID=A0AA86RV38_9FABA|nr:unnamed protein product [Sphenostylis stenocarpa]